MGSRGNLCFGGGRRVQLVHKHTFTLQQYKTLYSFFFFLERERESEGIGLPFMFDLSMLTRLLKIKSLCIPVELFICTV